MLIMVPLQTENGSQKMFLPGLNAERGLALGQPLIYRRVLHLFCGGRRHREPHRADRGAVAVAGVAFAEPPEPAVSTQDWLEGSV